MVYTACVFIELVNERRLPSASLASKMKDYVSPYAQPGESKATHFVLTLVMFLHCIVRKKSANVQKKSTPASIAKAKQRGIGMPVQ